MKTTKAKLGKYVSWYFLASLLVVLVGGFMAEAANAAWFPWVTIILGVLLAVFAVTVKESMKLLIAIIALPLGVSIIAQLAVFGEVLAIFLTSLIAFLAPVSTIVAIKVIFNVLKSK